MSDFGPISQMGPFSPPVSLEDLNCWMREVPYIDKQTSSGTHNLPLKPPFADVLDAIQAVHSLAVKWLGEEAARAKAHNLVKPDDSGRGTLAAYLQLIHGAIRLHRLQAQIEDCFPRGKASRLKDEIEQTKRALDTLCAKTRHFVHVRESAEAVPTAQEVAVTAWPSMARVVHLQKLVYHKGALLEGLLDMSAFFEPEHRRPEAAPETALTENLSINDRRAQMRLAEEKLLFSAENDAWYAKKTVEIQQLEEELYRDDEDE